MEKLLQHASEWKESLQSPDANEEKETDDETKAKADFTTAQTETLELIKEYNKSTDKNLEIDAEDIKKIDLTNETAETKIEKLGALLGEKQQELREITGKNKKELRTAEQGLNEKIGFLKKDTDCNCITKTPKKIDKSAAKSKKKKNIASNNPNRREHEMEIEMSNRSQLQLPSSRPTL